MLAQQADGMSPAERSLGPDDDASVIAIRSSRQPASASPCYSLQRLRAVRMQLTSSTAPMPPSLDPAARMHKTTPPHHAGPAGHRAHPIPHRTCTSGWRVIDAHAPRSGLGAGTSTARTHARRINCAIDDVNVVVGWGSGTVMTEQTERGEPSDGQPTAETTDTRCQQHPTQRKES